MADEEDEGVPVAAGELLAARASAPAARSRSPDRDAQPPPQKRRRPRGAGEAGERSPLAAARPSAPPPPASGSTEEAAAARAGDPAPLLAATGHASDPVPVHFGEYKKPTFDELAEASAAREAARQALLKKVLASDELPVVACRDDIVEAVRSSRVVVLVGETGSGKTTQVPQFLHHAGLAGPGGVVAVTQPRRIAAISVATRVAHEMGCPVGGLVGYHVRFDNRTSRSTKVKYMTDGMLVRESAGQWGLRNCGAVILDEAHERSVDTDVLMGLVKTALAKNDPPGLRVVVMSATMATAQFVEFFGGIRQVKLLDVPGRQHEVSVHYTPTPEPDFLEAALIAVLQLHVTRPKGDMLVFLPGQEDIDGLQRLLEDRREILREHRRRARTPQFAAAAEEERAGKVFEVVTEYAEADDFVVRPIYAALPFDQQELVFTAAPPGCRKIVLATNIAETSITISGIRYVIDTGFMKLKICHPQTGVEALKMVETSQAAAAQRAGRAGREAPGEAYRLYVESALNKMPSQTPAEILRCELASVYLQLKSLGIDNVMDFPLVDKPPAETLLKAAHFLTRIGALTRDDGLTEVGRKLAMLPVHPLYSYCLLMSFEFECTAEMLTIVAMLSADTPLFVMGNRRNQETAPKARPLLHEDGDHLTMLNAFQQVKKAGNKQGFARQHGLNLAAFDRAGTIRGQLKDLLQQSWGAKQISSCGPMKNWHMVRRALLKGCFTQTARRDEVNHNAYQTLLTRQVAKLHPQSALFRRAQPPACVIYAELTTTSKNFLRTVTEVDPAWLPELCPQYFAAGAKAAGAG